MAEPPPWGFHDLSPTTRWVLGHGLPTVRRPPSAPLSDDAWERLCSECRSHRLRGHLVAAVTDHSLRTTRCQRRQAATIELELTELRTRYDQVCRGVLDAFDDAGIPYRLIKGSALPWTDYPDPQQRPTADLDVLVPGSELAAAVAVLGDHGGSIMNPEPTEGFARLVFKGLTVVMPSGLEVDIHRLLSWGPLGVRVPEADLWAPGRTFDRLGHSQVTLSVERTLIHVSAHLLLLGAVRASELRDVAQLATSPALDPERTVGIARRWGHEAVLAVALRMAEREIGLERDAHPLQAWASQYHVVPRDRLWLRIDRPDSPVVGIEPAAVLTELAGWRPRATLLRAFFRPRAGTDPSPMSRLGHLMGYARPS